MPFEAPESLNKINIIDTMSANAQPLAHSRSRSYPEAVLGRSFGTHFSLDWLRAFRFFKLNRVFMMAPTLHVAHEAASRRERKRLAVKR